MSIPVFKIFMVFGIVSSWAAQALADGKITITEAADLGLKLGAALGVPTSVDVPQPTNIEGATETTDTEPPEETHGEPLNPKLAHLGKTTALEGGET